MYNQTIIIIYDLAINPIILIESIFSPNNNPYYLKDLLFKSSFQSLS